ncbi:MAG TPA: hypothetical protein VHW44_27620 [Pseudonocardiaceae bacterium]|jgi:hypothetical protein|nr:hypothetical protein [Pseudonocardiaceae bacterium]
MTSTTEQPTVVRRLGSPAALALADLVSIFDDLQTVLRCCERLVTELAVPPNRSDDLAIEAIWTTAALSYARCFATGSRGMGLTEDDVRGVKLQGEVLEWHKVLRELRKHYSSPTENPRERFEVGVVQDQNGGPGGIAVTSTVQPRLDDITVRQTGALAYELSQLVNQRITEHQERLFGTAGSMTAAELKKLPQIDVATPDQPET